MRNVSSFPRSLSVTVISFHALNSGVEACSVVILEHKFPRGRSSVFGAVTVAVGQHAVSPEMHLLNARNSKRYRALIGRPVGLHRHKQRLHNCERRRRRLKSDSKTKRIGYVACGKAPSTPMRAWAISISSEEASDPSRSWSAVRPPGKFLNAEHQHGVCGGDIS